MSGVSYDDEIIKRAAVFGEYTQLANKMGAVNLSQGIPEPLIDKHINAALAKSTRYGWQYTDTWGMYDLRNLITHKIYNRYFNVSNTLITSGCTESIYISLAQAANDYGDKVAFFEPFYPYYLGMVKIFNLKPVPIKMRLSDGLYTPDWTDFEELVHRGVRIIILNTPHNPTGWVMNNSDAEYLCGLANKYGICIIIDESYKKYEYDQDGSDAVRILYSGTKYCLIAGSFSKLLSATGIRVGWLIGRVNSLKKSYAVHLYLSYCQPPSLQGAIISMLNDSAVDKYLDDLACHYKSKRDLLVDALKSTEMSLAYPSGGHYILANYSDHFPEMSPEQFAEWFAIKYNVLPLPASCFYLDNASVREIRFSFAVSLADLKKASSRLYENRQRVNI